MRANPGNPDNPIWGHAFGVSWSLAKCFGVMAGVLLVFGVGLFCILFKHTKARARRLDPEEAGYVAVYSAAMVYDQKPIRSTGVGYGAELKVNIDSLRNAAKRGDWLTFWIWPAMMSCGFIGVWFSLMSVVIAFDIPRIVWIAVTVPVVLMVLVALFMPWAAIYTKIDLGADAPAVPSEHSK